MSSFEWMELESLSLEISNAEARLAEALSNQLPHLAKDIETQLVNAKARRERLVDTITQRAASIAVEEGDAAFAEDGADPDETTAETTGSEPETQPEAEFEAAFAPADWTSSALGEIDEDPVSPDMPADPEFLPASAEPISQVPETTDRPRPISAVNAIEGTIPMWEQFSPADIVRAKQELEERRTDMLARHAEELKALDAEYIEIANLERALEAFARKFSRQPEGGEVVQLDQERDLRMHGAA